MLEELEYARVNGILYQDIHVHIIRLVKNFIGKNYRKYPALGCWGVDVEEVETRVYQGLYNRTGILSNMEKYFLKASKMDNDSGMAYIVCIVRLAVQNSLKEMTRKVLNRNRDCPIRLDNFDSVYVDNLVGYIPGRVITDNLLYEDLLNRIPYKEYPYMLKVDNKLRRLTSRLFIDMLVNGYNQGDFTSIMYSDKTGNPVSKSTYSKVRGEVILLAREELKEFVKE